MELVRPRGPEFGLEGVKVALVARGAEALEECARELREETRGNFVTIIADTGDPESVTAMVKEAAEKLGRIDILVNSAARVGGAYAPKLAEITEDDFWADMNTKVMGYLRCAQAVGPYMIEQGWGRIINLSGMAARQAGYAVGSIRNVSVSALSKNLADELGPQGINVTTVHPGMTYTERIPALLEERAKAQGITVEVAEQQMAQGNSIKHIVDPKRGRLCYRLSGIP
ncbi:MAG: short-chain dehydrogenase [Dehalococcoidia bacterium]|nr:MAG: short-chain dehydrogenase [Dehalococcoidia bacterium]